MRSAELEEAYPRALWQRERVFFQARRRQIVGEERPPDDVAGVALSGGGIRSATFCLGVFQALARQRLIDRIDYLSTVSGGGYFGAFLGRLFTRKEVQSASDVERVLYRGEDLPGESRQRAASPSGLPDVLRWLRENGRYLSPNGAGDLLVGGAVAFRNWFAVQAVLLSFVFTGMALLQLARAGVRPVADFLIARLGLPGSWTAGLDQAAAWLRSLTEGRPDVSSTLWWSPFILAPLIPLLLVVVPAGWAYWVVGAVKGGHRWYENPALGLVLSAVLAAGVLISPAAGRIRWHAGWGLLGEAILTTVCWAVVSVIAWRGTRTWRGQPGVAENAVEGFWAAEQRNRLSHWLKSGLVATAALLTFALIDSLGQTAYVLAVLPGSQLGPILASLLAVLTGAAGLAPRLAILLGGRPDGKRLRLPASVLAIAAAIAVVGLLLLAIDMLTHAIAWGGCIPELARNPSWWTDPQAKGCWRQDRAVGVLAIVWGVAVVACLVFGRSWPFLNNSSLHALYSARLTRAYLGASNPRRAHEDAQAVTRVLPEDNAALADYWRGPASRADAEPAPCQKGAPIHLINVTINETLDGRSQVQQQDRKGVGLAVGPCALSVGVRHHAIFPSHADLDRADVGDVTVAPAAGRTYRVFEALKPGRWRGGERLTVGQWVGISGAAFSTGLGARTNLGLSLLCGLSNVRLGYWWNSDVQPCAEGARPRWPQQWLERIFPLQTYLLRELMSRFSGTARPRWYLSDGGHFENTGGYELIRRRLLRMVIVDAEADPAYTFEGLANLVRKARLDFGAEIRFLSAPELDGALAPSHRHLFGTLEDLRRGSWAAALVKDPDTSEPRLAIDNDRARYSRAHAALARVRWADEPSRLAWLVYLKPTLTGDEPADVTQYHRGHPEFPQETTNDQFFDEAQWESYRMLGFTIADAVFSEGEELPERSPRARIFAM